MLGICLIIRKNKIIKYFFDDAKVPDQIQDIINVLTWIENNISSYPINKNKIYLIGESAGAYLATMAVLISENKRLQDIFKISKSNLKINAMAIISGFMEWTRNEIKYWGMRSMMLEKGYKRQEYYRNLILQNIPEINSLPPLFVTTNGDDELKFMTSYFLKILEGNNVEHKFYYLEKNKQKKLGHMFNVLHPEWEESIDLNNTMLGAYLIGSTSSHYDWGLKTIKPLKKMIQRKSKICRDTYLLSI